MDHCAIELGGKKSQVCWQLILETRRRRSGLQMRLRRLRRLTCSQMAITALVLDDDVRVRRSLRDARVSQDEAVRLHRGVLQPGAQALDAGLRQPSRFEWAARMDKAAA